MANEIDRKALAQKWVHSHEEDTDDAGPGARKTVMQILHVAPDKLVVKKR